MKKIATVHETPRLILGVIIGLSMGGYSLVTGTVPSRRGMINIEATPEIYWGAVSLCFLVSFVAIFIIISRLRKNN